MCIVIDANTLSAVLDKENEQHQEFLPVLKWVLEGKGKIVYGGSTYRREVFEKMPRFNRFVQELVRLRKTIMLPAEDVDREEQRIRAIESSTDFDDPHIVAILDVSGCFLLCSGDKRSDRFVKNKKFYKNRSAPPKIYRCSRYHRKLLNDGNIAECCRPDVVLGRNAREGAGVFL